MIYIAHEPDGTFAGYYNRGSFDQEKRGYVMTFLDGGSCAWNYTAACGAADEPCVDGYPGANPECRAAYDVDATSGLPFCSEEPNRTTTALTSGLTVSFPRRRSFFPSFRRRAPRRP